MRIAILGNNIGSLVLAHELSERGHQVDLYGKPDPLADFVRDSAPLQKWLPEAERITYKTMWAEDGALAYEPSRESIEGYRVKTRNENTPPKQMTVVINGPRLLRKYLDLERFEPILGAVESVQRMRVNGQQYDRIVSLIPPERFPGLKNAPRLTPLRYYYGSSLSGMRAKPSPDVYVFSGEGHVWWYQAFYSDNRWLHICRSPDGPAEDRWNGQFAEYLVGIQPARTRWKYPKGVVPMGRYAEWRNDLTMGETIGNVPQYIKLLEAPLAEVES